MTTPAHQTITVPALSSKVDPEVKRAIQALVMHLQQVAATSSSGTEGAQTEGLSESDVMQIVDDVLAETPLFQPDYTIPIAPTGLTATGAFNQILLQWSPVAAGYVGHYEIFRHAADNLAEAVKIGTTSAAMYADSPPDSSLATGYYYWVRAVNRWDATIVGPFNATAGTMARTADDPDYLLQLAAEKWRPNHNYALGALVMPTRPNGYCYEVTTDGGASGAEEPAWPTVLEATVSDGDLIWTCKASFSFEQFFKLALVDGVPRLTLKDLFLADGIIKKAMMSELSVDDANIISLAGNKITANSITASQYHELRNSLIFNGWDSLDNVYPFEFPFLLLSELTAIQSIKLSFKIMPYRGYSKAALNAAPSTTQVDIPTHNHSFNLTRLSSTGTWPPLYYGDGKLWLITSTTGQKTFTLTTTDGHNHTFIAYFTTVTTGKTEVKYDFATGLLVGGGKIFTSSGDGHVHVLDCSSPAHGTTLPVVYDGSSSLRLYDPGGSWTTKTVLTEESPSKHYHTVSHAHDISFGIFEENNSPTINLQVDNGAGFGGTIGPYTTDQLNLDLTSLISGAGWKRIRFAASARCRIAFVLECKLDISA
jgi:hypothetical protein